MKKDYYLMLGVAKNASDDEIKKAFRKLAHQYHPDKQGGDEAKFKEVNEAYQVLSDSSKRQKYDQFGSDYDHHAGAGTSWEDFARQSGFGFQGGVDFDIGDLGDMVGEMFGFGRRGGRAARHGAHLQIELTLEFREAVFGTTKEVRVTRNILCHKCSGNGAEPGTPIATCSSCKGSGQVVSIKQTFLGAVQTASVCTACRGQGKTAEKPCKECRGNGAVRKEEKLAIHIPAGIDNGETLRLQGQGHTGEHGSPAGDLYATVRVRPDKLFRRDGADLYRTTAMRMTDSVLGAKIPVETLDGEVEMTIPPGTVSGTRFRLADMGVPHVNRQGRGSLIVEAVVSPPRSLNKKQRELLEQLKKEGL
ncbi:MAG: molecular chaperone DnaJ [Patescibacteria group bacterium]